MRKLTFKFIDLYYTKQVPETGEVVKEILQIMNINFGR